MDAREGWTGRKARVVVVGDSGSGKTALARRIARGRRGGEGSEYGGIARTVGCRVEVVFVDDDGGERGGGEDATTTRGTTRDDGYFVELWDVGGHRQYKRERGVFYDEINGVIIVHDASTRSSGARCEAWAREVARMGTFSAPTRTPSERFASAELACVLYGFGGLPVPCLIVANKIDLEQSGDGDARGGGLGGAIQRLWRKLLHRRRRFVLPQTVGEASSVSDSFGHRRQPSIGMGSLDVLPPGGGLRTSATLGHVDLDVVHAFFRELVRRRYNAADDPGISTTFGSERLLHTVPTTHVVDDDYDDLT